MRKKSLIWDKWNKDHIKKHQVAVSEVEEVYKSKKLEQNSYLKRKIILGKTKNERLLTIIISFEKQQNPYVVSARDMSKKERRLYYEHQKKFNKKT